MTFGISEDRKNLGHVHYSRRCSKRNEKDLRSKLRVSVDVIGEQLLKAWILLHPRRSSVSWRSAVVPATDCPNFLIVANGLGYRTLGSYDRFE